MEAMLPVDHGTIKAFADQGFQNGGVTHAGPGAELGGAGMKAPGEGEDRVRRHGFVAGWERAIPGARPGARAAGWAGGGGSKKGAAGQGAPIMLNSQAVASAKHQLFSITLPEAQVEAATGGPGWLRGPGRGRA